METLQLLSESENARRVAVLPDERAYGGKVAEALEKWEKKDRVTVFGMNPPVQASGKYRYEMMGYAILQSLGIRADEL